MNTFDGRVDCTLVPQSKILLGMKFQVLFFEFDKTFNV